MLPRPKKLMPGTPRRTRRYTDPKMQAFYDRLRELGSVEALYKAGIFGAIRSAYQCGIEGKGPCVSWSRGSAALTAYYAGVDSRKQA